MIPAVLFDMNGVLIDDENLHQQAFQEVARQAGLSLTTEDYLAFFAGRTDEGGFQAFFSERAPARTAEIESFMVGKTRAYQNLAETGLRRYTGAAELVGALHDTRHQLALVTSSILSEVAVVLDFLRLGDAFDAVVTAEDVTEGKPSPMPYLTGASRLERGPSECVVIEDAPSGVSSAKAAGMKCIAIASTHAPDDLAQADLLVERISDLTSEVLYGMVN